jgi:hypothetical protein
MLRKIAVFGFALILGVALVACSGEDNNTADEETPAPGEQQSDVGNEQQPDGANEAANQPEENEVVAKVNGEEIIGSKYLMILQQVQMSMQQQGQDINDEAVAEIIHNQTMENVIANQLILQDANKKGYKPKENQVQEQLDQIIAQFESDEELDEVLKTNNLTMEQLEKQIYEDLTMQSYMEKEIEVPEISDEEIQQIYDQYAGQSEDSPPLIEVESQIRASLEQQNAQEQMTVIVEGLKANSEIEIFI